MDQYTHEVCAEYWKGIINACGLKADWTKMVYATRVAIIGRKNSENRLMI